LQPSAWGGRVRPSSSGQATLGSTALNDVLLLLELDATVVDGLACSAELTPDLRLAIAQLGHHQLGVVVGATTAVLMMSHIGFPVGLSAVVALPCCILVIMWMHEIPLLLIIASGGWLEVLLMVWATSCVAASIAATGLTCTHWVRQLCTTIGTDLGDSQADGADAEDGALLRSVRTALFLLHPFETFAICVSGVTRLTTPSLPLCRLPLTQQSPKAARRAGATVGGTLPTEQYVVESARALMMVVLVIKLPGTVAKWSSSGGVYGPMQQAWLLADVDASTLWEWAGRVGAAAADSVTAAVLTSATQHMSGSPLRRSAERRPWVGVARAVACLGVLCAGRDLYVLPWAIAVLLVVVPVDFVDAGGEGGGKDV